MTPGQIAYAAYLQRFVAYQHHALGTVMPEPWAHLPLLVQICWEAAAQAVLPGTPSFQCALGQHVRRTSDPAQRWEIWWRSYREDIGRTTIDYGLRLIDPTSEYRPCRMSDGSDLVPVEETR